MLNIIILGFIFGFFCPLIARRFAKFMPADPSAAFIESFHLPRIPKNKNAKYIKLWKDLLIYCVISGIISALCLSLVYYKTENYLYIGLMSLLILMTAIDLKLYILPDVLTIPLILLGFTASYFYDLNPMYDSILGALAGYFGIFIIGIIVYFIKRDAFGGGDYKTLAGIGAWLGLYGLCFSIFISAILGLIIAFFIKTRGIAYGLPLTVAVFLTILFKDDLILLLS